MGQPDTACHFDTMHLAQNELQNNILRILEFWNLLEQCWRFGQCIVNGGNICLQQIETAAQCIVSMVQIDPEQ